MLIPAIDTVAKVTPTQARALYNAGRRAFFGYLGLLNPYHMTAAQLKIWRDAKFSMGFFSEHGSGKTFNAQTGDESARDGLAHAKTLGIPRGVGICVAVDYDMQSSGFAGLEAHLNQWKAKNGGLYKDGGYYRIGLYGPPQVLQAFRDKVDYIIQPSAWSYGKKLSGIAMFQVSVSQQLCGVNVDLDEVYDDSILWKAGDAQVSYPAVKVIFNGKQYPAVDINNDTYFIWTLAKDAGVKFSKVAYNDIEIGGKKIRQWADGKDTYLCYADVPGIHPVRLPDKSGWEFVKDFVEPADVKGDPNEQAIIWALQNGLMAVDSGGNFHPTDPVTKSEAAASLQKLADILKK